MYARTMLLSVALLVIGASPAASQPTGCTRDKLSASARVVQERIRCHADAIRAGGVVAGECLERASARLLASFERADRRAGACDGSAATVEQVVEADLRLILAVVPGTGSCPAQKVTAAARKIARRLRCRMRDAARVLACLSRADARFVEAFARAEHHGSCGGDADTVESLADVTASAVAIPIAGPPPSTTSTTTLPPVCGNGVVESGEQCDGQTYCGADCGIGPTACCAGSADAAFCGDFQPSRQMCLLCISAGGQCMRGLCAGLECVDRAIVPVVVCCQFPLGECTMDVATSIGELGGLYEDCEGFPFGIGICGVDGVCRPAG